MSKLSQQVLAQSKYNSVIRTGTIDLDVALKLAHEVESLEQDARATGDFLNALLHKDPCIDGNLCLANELALLEERTQAGYARMRSCFAVASDIPEKDLPGLEACVLSTCAEVLDLRMIAKGVRSTLLQVAKICEHAELAYSTPEALAAAILALIQPQGSSGTPVP